MHVQQLCSVLTDFIFCLSDSVSPGYIWPSLCYAELELHRKKTRLLVIG